MAGWAASGSRQVRGACAPATPGSGGTTSAGALTCTGCWDCAGLLVRPGISCRNLASHVFDFGELRVPITDERVRVYLFVATLGYSRRCHVEAFRHERQSSY